MGGGRLEIVFLYFSLSFFLYLSSFGSGFGQRFSLGCSDLAKFAAINNEQSEETIKWLIGIFFEGSNS